MNTENRTQTTNADTPSMPDPRHNLRLVIHTSFGLVTFETADHEEIQAAADAIGRLRTERNIQADPDGRDGIRRSG